MFLLFLIIFLAILAIVFCYFFVGWAAWLLAVAQQSHHPWVTVLLRLSAIAAVVAAPLHLLYASKSLLTSPILAQAVRNIL